MKHLDSRKTGATLAAAVANGPSPGGSFLPREKAVGPSPFAFFWFVCRRHFFLTGYEHIINIFRVFNKFLSESKKIYYVT